MGEIFVCFRHFLLIYMFNVWNIFPSIVMIKLIDPEDLPERTKSVS